MLGTWNKLSSQNNKDAVTIRRFAFFIVLISLVLISPEGISTASAAGFSTNFQPELSIWGTENTGACTFGGCASQSGNTDPTPMAESVVQINGVWYYHVIVGDPAAGFAMESYNRAAPLNLTLGSNPGSISNSGAAFSPDGGGNLTSVIGNFGSPGTTCTSNCNGFLSPVNDQPVGTILNSANSLGNAQVSGTGGNDPRYTAFRMVMTDPSGGMSMDVVKPFLDKKPMISQTVQDGVMTSTFVTDQRGLNYSQGGTAAPLINNLTLNDPSIPGVNTADFAMSQSQQSVVTSGRFVYIPGTGYHNDEGDPTLGWNSTNSTFDFGTYDYSAGGGNGFQPMTTDWSQFFDYSQNANSCTAMPAKNGFNRETGNANAGLAPQFGGSCFNKP